MNGFFLVRFWEFGLEFVPFRIYTHSCVHAAVKSMKMFADKLTGLCSISTEHDDNQNACLNELMADIYICIRYLFLFATR